MNIDELKAIIKENLSINVKTKYKSFNTDSVTIVELKFFDEVISSSEIEKLND